MTINSAKNVLTLAAWIVSERIGWIGNSSQCDGRRKYLAQTCLDHKAGNERGSQMDKDLLTYT